MSKRFHKRFEAIKIPDGFTGTFKPDTWDPTHKDEVFSLKSADVELVFDEGGSGHTRFLHKGAWLSFDRTGVEDSFYHVPLFKGHGVSDLNVIVAEQIERVKKRLEYFASAVSIPGIPFTVAPDGVEPLKQRLAKTGVVSFHPSGFGTGYRLTKRPTRGGGEQRALAATETFFGVSPLYVSTLDCD